MDKTFLLVVDAYSKWPGIIEMSSTATYKAITELHKIFPACILPAQLLSGNSPQFTAEKFASSCKSMAINTFNVHHSILLQKVLLNA